MSEANGLDPKVAYSVLGLAALGFIGAAAWFAREPRPAPTGQNVPSASVQTAMSTQEPAHCFGIVGKALNGRLPLPTGLTPTCGNLYENFKRGVQQPPTQWSELYSVTNIDASAGTLGNELTQAGYSLVHREKIAAGFEQLFYQNNIAKKSVIVQPMTLAGQLYLGIFGN